MKNYILNTAVTASCLHRIFEAAVCTTCAGDYTPTQINAWVEQADLQRWNDLLQSGLFFMAAEYVPTHEIVGFTSVDSTGYLHSMFVHPAHQRKGVAAFLLRAAEEFAREHKAVALDAEVSITAQPFFLKNGFKMMCAQKVEVMGVELDNFVMHKPLIYKVGEAEYEELLQLWETSVRHTHHFLSDADILFYKLLIAEQCFPDVSLYALYNIMGKIVAFIGVKDKMIEMLFVHPDVQGKGYGSLLVDFAVRQHSVCAVDVNEQNEEALKFYLHKGFHIVGRDEQDGFGKNYPVLHLNLTE